MNLKDMLKEAIATLTEVKKAVMKGEKSAAELQAAIDKVQDLQARIKAADEAENILNAIGTPGEKDPEKPVQAKSLGEHFANFVKAKGRIATRDGFNLVAPDYVKAYAEQITLGRCSLGCTSTLIVDSRLLQMSSSW